MIQFRVTFSVNSIFKHWVNDQNLDKGKESDPTNMSADVLVDTSVGPDSSLLLKFWEFCNEVCLHNSFIYQHYSDGRSEW